MLQMSDHSEIRAAQRRLTAEEIEYVRYFGKRFFAEGAVVYYLRRKDLPAYDRRDSRLSRLVGTAVVMSEDLQKVITVWRNRKSGLKLIRRKADSPRHLRSTSPNWDEDFNLQV